MKLSPIEVCAIEAIRRVSEGKVVIVKEAGQIRSIDQQGKFQIPPKNVEKLLTKIPRKNRLHS